MTSRPTQHLRPTLAVVGSINMDLTVTTPRVPLTGENLLAHGWQMALGGKGANAAVALARLGAEAHMIGCVGDDDAGRAALATLGAEHVSAGGVVVTRQTPTGLAVILVDDRGENTILVAIGANLELGAESVEAALAPLWGTLDALVVNFELAEPAVASAIHAAHTHSVPVIVDAGPSRTYRPATWGLADILSPNASEAATLVGYPVIDEASARRATRDLLRQGPKAIVLKWGARGALLCTESEEQIISGYTVPVVDTTGAGDAFTAGLAFALVEGRALDQAVRFANAVGAIAVTRLGAMASMPMRTEVDALLNI